MSALTFVTSNSQKAASLTRIFQRRNVRVAQVSLDLPEPQHADLRCIAESKARYAHQRLARDVVVQDAGFFLEAWPGFPGTFTKHAVETLGTSGILKLLEGNFTRRCAFRECIAYFDGKIPRLFEGSIPGTVTQTERGTLPDGSTSHLWRIFIPDGEHLTLAEMTENEWEVWRQKRTNIVGEVFAEWYCGSEGPLSRL